MLGTCKQADGVEIYDLCLQWHLECASEHTLQLEEDWKKMIRDCVRGFSGWSVGFSDEFAYYC